MEEKKRIRVVVCGGTACHLLGGTGLQLLSEALPEAARERVEVVGSPCLDLCRCRTGRRPPFVQIDGEEVAAATVDEVLDRVQERLGREGER